MAKKTVTAYQPIPKNVTRWCGPVPKTCDTCETSIEEKFYDAKTSLGFWASMCPSCFTLGPGLGKLGPGLGQEFTYREDTDTFVKTGG